MSTSVGVRHYENGIPHKIRDLHSGNEHAVATFEDWAVAASVTPVGSSDSAVTLKAANTSRRGLLVYNDSTANLFLKLGSGASSSSFTFKLEAGDYYELPRPMYTGIVTGIWSAVNGNALVTELT